MLRVTGRMRPVTAMRLAVEFRIFLAPLQPIKAEFLKAFGAGMFFSSQHYALAVSRLSREIRGARRVGYQSADGDYSIAVRIALRADDPQPGAQLVRRADRLIAVLPAAPAETAPAAGEHQVAEQVVAEGDGIPAVAVFVVVAFFPVEHGAIIKKSAASGRSQG